MKKYLCLLILTLFVTDIFAQTETENQKHAKIRFYETTHNFDTIAKGSEGVCCFDFINEGNEPLIISSAFSSCGCTVPSWSQKPVLPDEKGSITVKYNTNKTGVFKKAIVVKSNSQPDTKTILWINGIIKQES